MIHSYEFRLAFLLSGVAFIIASSYGQSLTGVWWAVGVLAAHFFLCWIFGTPYAFDVLPIDKFARSNLFDFIEQYSTLRNLYTHPVTISSWLLVFGFSDSIIEQSSSSWWSSIGYMLLAVILFIAWPARIWGNFASMIVDASEENLNRKGSTAGGFEAE